MNTLSMYPEEYIATLKNTVNYYYEKFGVTVRHSNVCHYTYLLCPP